MINDPLKTIKFKNMKHIYNNNSQYLITCHWWVIDFSKVLLNEFVLYFKSKYNLLYKIKNFRISFFTQKINLSFQVKRKLVILSYYLNDKKVRRFSIKEKTNKQINTYS